MAPTIRAFTGTSGNDLGGLTFTPDSNGAVDRRYFVELLNGAFAIYDKATGALIGPRVSAIEFWARAGIQQPVPTDPRIVFVPDAGRHGQWLAVQLDIGNSVFIATTDPNDPLTDPSLGKWKASEFPLIGNDAVMLGYDLDGIYLGSNTSEKEGLPRAPQIVCIPRANALAWPPRVGPDDIKVIGPLRTSDWPNSLFPVMDQSGIGWPYETTIAVNTWSGRHLVFGLISHQVRDIVSHFQIEVPPFKPIDPGHGLMQPYSWGPAGLSALYYNTGIAAAPFTDGGFNIWLAHTVKKPDYGPLVIRWYRLAIDPVTRMPGLAATGEIGQPRYDCFNPSILSFGKDDTTVVSFSRSGNPDTPSNPDDPACGNIGAYVALVRESDPDRPEVFAVRSGKANNYMTSPNMRWGDYSTICRDPDPAHPRRLWTSNQYVLQGGANTSRWGEVFASIDVPAPWSATPPSRPTP
jgi:hypothetical protein